jgi:hypothetical protein
MGQHGWANGTTTIWWLATAAGSTMGAATDTVHAISTVLEKQFERQCCRMLGLVQYEL